MTHNTRRYTFLLIGVLLALFLALAGGAAAEPAAVSAAESEPNDTIATADPVAIGDTTAAIGVEGDVDYFRLSLSAGSRIYIAAIENCDAPELDLALSVYDANGVLVVEATDEWPGNHVLLRFVPPDAGNYNIRVVSDGYPYSPEELTGAYTLLIRDVPADEPDDPFEPVTFHPTDSIESDMFAPFDFDWYVFHALPGEVIRAILNMDTVITDEVTLRINDVDNTYPYAASRTLDKVQIGDNVIIPIPFESDYVVTVANGIFHCSTREAQPYRLAVFRKSLYVAGAKPGTVDGVKFGTNDILARNGTGAWAKVFDGEDVGITGPLSAFEFLPDRSLLLSFGTVQTLSDVGMVRPQDVVRFVPARLGENTQGSFSPYIRGAGSGLTTQGERIDAIVDWQMISTFGSASVPKYLGGTLNARDEDILLMRFNGAPPADGSWELDFNGRQELLGFSGQDIRAATALDSRYENIYDDTYHFVRLILSSDRSYRYWAPLGGDYLRFTAAPGDLMFLSYDTYPGGSSFLWPPITRQTLGFPRAISGISVGPAWTP